MSHHDQRRMWPSVSENVLMGHQKSHVLMPQKLLLKMQDNYVALQ